MNKRISFPIIFLVFYFQIFQFANQVLGSDQPLKVELSAFVEPHEVPLNKTVDYIIRITWTGNLKQIEIEEVETPLFSNFDVLGTASSNQISGTAEGKVAVKEIRYTLQPQTLGMGYIEPGYLTYKNVVENHIYELNTQRIPVEVLPAVSTPSQKQFPWMLFGVVVIIIIAGIALYKKLKKNVKEDIVPQIPLEEKMLSELKEKIDLKNQDRNESISVLSKLYRSYLAEKFNISALEITTQELLQSLKGLDLEERLIIKSKSLFEKADIIKFSGKTATQAELDEAYITVETVLETQQKSSELNTEDKE